MNILVKHLVFFSFLAIVLIVLVVSITIKVVNQKEYYEIPKDKHILAIGHSHGSSALIDTNLNGVFNVCSGGETYNFTYAKIQRLLESNNQIDSVLLFVSNNLFDDQFDARFWDENQIGHRLKTYFPHMDIEFMNQYLKKYPFSFLNSALVSTKENLSFIILGKERSFLTSGMWGGYDLHQGVIKNYQKKDTSYQATETFDNMKYLEKIVAYCKEKRKEVVFISTPLNAAYQINLHREDEFLFHLNRICPECIFIDYRKFALSDSCFLNIDHLNYVGAQIFTEDLKKNWNSYFSKGGDTKQLCCE
jgi:hypothetical protein